MSFAECIGSISNSYLGLNRYVELEIFSLKREMQMHHLTRTYLSTSSGDHEAAPLQQPFDISPGWQPASQLLQVCQ
jgi:hypothetical protein